MAEGLNRVMLLGNLGADPELKYTQSGQAILHIRLATTESYVDKDKVRREKTEWHSISVWGKRGEALAKILTKGSSIFVEGGLRTTSYEDKEHVKRSKTEIVANHIILAGGRGRSSEDFGGEHSSSYSKSPSRTSPSNTAPAFEDFPPEDFSGDDDIPF